MASTGDRIRQLINDNLEVDGQPINLPDDLNVSLSGAGLSSTDLVSFAKLLSQEFNVTFSPEDCTRLDSVQKVVEFIDSSAA